MDIKKVGVVGCGLMGHGITQVCAQAGYDVVVREVDQERLDSGLGKIKKQLGARGREGQDGAVRRRTRSSAASRERSPTTTSPIATW